MKPGVKNFAHIEGTLVFDPRVNPTAGGSGVTNIKVAVPTGHKDFTCRIDVVAWHRDTPVPDGLKAGSYVVAEGRMVSRSYDDKKTGQKVNVTELVAESLLAPPHKQIAPKADPAQDDIPF